MIVILLYVYPHYVALFDPRNTAQQTRRTIAAEDRTTYTSRPFQRVNYLLAATAISSWIINY